MNEIASFSVGEYSQGLFCNPGENKWCIELNGIHTCRAGRDEALAVFLYNISTFISAIANTIK